MNMSKTAWETSRPRMSHPPQYGRTAADRCENHQLFSRPDDAVEQWSRISVICGCQAHFSPWDLLHGYEQA